MNSRTGAPLHSQGISLSNLKAVSTGPRETPAVASRNEILAADRSGARGVPDGAGPAGLRLRGSPSLSHRRHRPDEVLRRLRRRSPRPSRASRSTARTRSTTATPPAYRDNGDGTVTDLNTGLMWVQARGAKVTWDAAVAGAAACRVGGHSRLADADDQGALLADQLQRRLPAHRRRLHAVPRHEVLRASPTATNRKASAPSTARTGPRRSTSARR